MIDITRLFDSYSRQARLYPALLVLVPPVVLLIAYAPGILGIGSTLLSIAVACGVLFLLADYARTCGKRIEPVLLHEWGGWPTTIWLRHSDNHLPVGTKMRYHGFLSAQLGVAPLPTAEEERTEPATADAAYESAVMWLKERCRGKGYPLVERENTIYGFRRNLLGIKQMGVAVTLLTLVTPPLIFVASRGMAFGLGKLISTVYLSDPAVFGATMVAAFAFLAWITIVRRKWVREAGDQYARALLACCDILRT